MARKSKTARVSKKPKTRAVKAKGKSKKTPAKKKPQKAASAKTRVKAAKVAAPKKISVKAEKVAPEPKKKAAKAKVVAEVNAAPANPEPKSQVKKVGVSPVLMETIARRKKEQEAKGNSGPSRFSKPVRRRGRRPKRPVEYTPTHSEEEENSGSFESDYNSVETGIRAADRSDEGVFSLDRYDDYDEELNFDN